MSSGRSKVFISYARKDGADLAQRLQADLRAKRFDAWLDTQRIAGGVSWTRKIEKAIDDCKAELALLTPGSYESDICRAEQLRALRKGKSVIPLLAQSGSDIPLHLEAGNYRDFTGAKPYGAEFKLLIEDIRLGRNAAPLRPEFVTTYVTAPPPPRNYIKRPKALESLRNALVGDGSGPSIALTALEGMGGIGKTILAQALCHEEVVQQAYPDGIVWITAGRESAYSLVTRMREVGKALKDDLAGYDNELGCINSYRTVMRKKAALIVVDDVWRSGDIEPFRAESPRSRLLFTTRDASIAAAMGAEKLIADLLTPAQSRQLLARWSGSKPKDLPAEAEDIMQECGRLPLALAMIGAMLRAKPLAYWKYVLGLLRNANLERIKAQFPDYPHTDLLRAIQVSADALEPRARERYLALAVLLEDMPIPPVIQQTLWGADELDALAWQPPKPGADSIASRFRMAVFGDRGTGLYGAPVLARAIAADKASFQVVLHLGDTYYSGDTGEIQERLLADWPIVSGALDRSLHGNHEMYTGGHAYFDIALKKFSQPSSCFALQNDHWLVVGLDTSYSDHDIYAEEMPWLQSLIAQAGDRRLIFFSHHQPYSLLDVQGPKLIAKLEPYLKTKRIFAWYWGHEHHCVLYDEHPVWALLGRCIGHGGFPYFRDAGLGSAPSKPTWVRLNSKNLVPGGAVLDGQNPYIRGHETEYGPHGYAVLEFDGPWLKECIVDCEGSTIRSRQLVP